MRRATTNDNEDFLKMHCYFLSPLQDLTTRRIFSSLQPVFEMVSFYTREAGPLRTSLHFDFEAWDTVAKIHVLLPFPNTNASLIGHLFRLQAAPILETLNPQTKLVSVMSETTRWKRDPKFLMKLC